MGFLDLFTRRAAPAKSPAPISVDIDVTESCIMINGKAVTLPCHISKLNAVLGEPRKCGKLAVWDDSGLFCYKKSRNEVYCIAAHLMMTATDNYGAPANLFSGSVTIGGKPWTDFVDEGEDILLAKQVSIGNYSLSFVYKIYENTDEAPETEEFTDIEIELR